MSTPATTLGNERLETSATNWVWPTLVLALCHAQAIASFQILNILIDPIKAALAIADTQYSLLQGLAVAIFAALLGIPAARWADRRGRRNVILVGALGWSLATVGCAFVANFSELFVGRILMGVGEVFLFPAALSLISDLAPQGRLSRAVAIFGAGGPIGAAAALLGGSWILTHRALLIAAMPSLSGLDGWRIAFLLCGLTGLIAVVLLLTVAEPTRRIQFMGPGDSVRAIRDWLLANWRGYVAVSGGMLCLALCAFATSAWGPTVLTRVLDMSLGEAGRLTAAAALIGGIVLAFASGFIVDLLHRVGRADGVLLAGVVLAFAIMAFAIIALIPRNEVGIGAWVGLYALLGIPTVLAGTAIPMMTPRPMRSQVMAVHLLLMNLLALSLGPFLVALLTDRVFANPAAAGTSLTIIDASAAALAAVLLLAGRRSFKKSCLAA